MDTYPLAFARARELFDQTLSELRSEGCSQLDHEALESLVGERGNELMRQLVQGYLDLRAAREERPSMKGSDGVTRSYRRRSWRTLMTLFGPTRVSRLSLAARGSTGALRPLDAELNLPRTRYSAGLERRVVDEAIVGSFDHVVERIQATTGGQVPKRQAEEVVVRAAQDFEAFYAGRPLTSMKDNHVVVLSFDGKGVVMHEADLRPDTKKRAERGRKLKHRISPGEKPNRKRMAQVATVYEVARVPRTPEQVLRLEEGPERPKARNKRVWATLTTERVQVVDDAFHHALLRDPSMSSEWAVLVDGDPAQIDYVQRVAASYGVKPFLVLDLIHVLERLWTAAWCLFDKGTPEAEEWVSRRLLRLLHGHASRLAGDMRRSATMRGLSADQRRGIESCANYLLKYKDLLRYDRALARGIPIATGVIEGACRHLIKDRMDLTGARWRLPRAEAVLRLRSLKSSGDLDDYWAFHRRQELYRNHLVHYADSELDGLREAA